MIYLNMNTFEER